MEWLEFFWVSLSYFLYLNVIKVCVIIDLVRFIMFGEIIRMIRDN